MSMIRTIRAIIDGILGWLLCDLLRAVSVITLIRGTPRENSAYLTMTLAKVPGRHAAIVF